MRTLFPLLKTVAGHRIERRAPGFEFTPGLLGKISTYVVFSPRDDLQVFAFMYSFLVAGAADEERLAAEALEIVERGITAPGGRGALERTFEYAPEGWREVSSPRWWVGVSPSPALEP